MLQKLYEQIDSKVLTADVRESLEREFAAAVDSRASAIADSRVEEIEAELLEQHQQKLQKLDESATEYEAKLRAEYDELNEECNSKLEEHKLMLNEKAQEYIDERLEEINHNIDLYASRVADSLVEEAKQAMVDQNTVLKANAMYNAMSTFAALAGRNVGLEINETVKNVNDEYNDRISQLIEENRALKDQVKSLNNHLVFEQATSDLSMYQKERMRLSVAGLLESSDTDDLKTNLMNLKESYNSEPELKFSEPKKTTGISDLLFKNV